MAQTPQVIDGRKKAVAECDSFPRLAGHRFTYCPTTDYAIAKKGVHQYTLMKPTGEITAYYDHIKLSNYYNKQPYFAIRRGKQVGVMNMDGKIILPLDNYADYTYRYHKGLVICGTLGHIGDVDYKQVCYDEKGNRATQYEVD